MKDGPGGYRKLVSTLFAKEKTTRHFPSATSAFGALKSIGPSEGSQVSDACFFRGKAVPEFRQIARVVFHARTLQVVGG